MSSSQPGRPWWVVVLAGVTALGLLAVWLVPAATPPLGALHFETRVRDLGEWRTGLTSVQSFAFTNHGLGTVEIVALRPGCGCLLPRLEKRLWGAGEAGTIPVEVRSLGERPGPHVWHLHLTWRSASVEKDETLEVRAHLTSEINLQPTLVTLHSTGPARHELLLTDQRAHPLQVQASHTSTPHLHARALPRERLNDGPWLTRIEVATSADCPPGRREEKVVLTTDDPLYTQLEATVVIDKRAAERLRVTPSEVELRGGSRLVEIRDPTGAAVVLRSVSANHPALRCTWARGPESAATIKVQLDPGKPHAPTFEALLLIEAEQPAGATLRVPVRVSASK